MINNETAIKKILDMANLISESAKQKISITQGQAGDVLESLPDVISVVATQHAHAYQESELSNLKIAWFENNANGKDEYALIVMRVHNYLALSMLSEPDYIWLNLDEYGWAWRLWDREPSYEERIEVKWTA